jgi:hypothetical protein
VEPDRASGLTVEEQRDESAIVWFTRPSKPRLERGMRQRWAWAFAGGREISHVLVCHWPKKVFDFSERNRAGLPL